MYFSFFKLKKWGKKTAAARRHNCAVLPYNPIFHDGTRINLMQVWDHNPDGSIIFNLLYTFEQNNKIVQKEIFEEHYHPFPLELATAKLREMGYGAPEVKPVPCFFPETDFSKIDWYRIIAQKQ